MMKFIQTLQAKPSDTTIRLIRAVFALLTLLVLALAVQYDVLIVQFSLPKELVYILFIFPLIGLIRAIFDPGIFRRKIWKWTNVTLGVIMIILGWWFVEDKAPVITSVPTNTTTQSGISLSSLGTQAVVIETVSFNADLYFALLGWILLTGALVFNNKNITTKNERYGETIKKIRV